MNVDLNWIKQRPQFIAEELSIANEVVILYPYSWKRRLLVKNIFSGARSYPFFRLPFGGSFRLIEFINLCFYKLMSFLLFKLYSFDILWISSPELYGYLSKAYKAKLVYDCMDDVLAFPGNHSKGNSLLNLEIDLLKKSSFIFCSSINLLNKIKSRSEVGGNYYLVRNGVDPLAFKNNSNALNVLKNKNIFILGYFGTIDSWLDFQCLLDLVNRYPTVELHLMGPISCPQGDLPAHTQIKYLGVIPHCDLKVYCDPFDALIIPFKRTELILSVDPVKLYEYIYLNKPVISVRYPEIERFEQFIDFYSNNQELIDLVGGYLENGFKKKYTDEMRQKFIDENTWKKRVDLIKEIMVC